MGELASKAQLRNSYLRWAIVTVPACLLLGFLMSKVANSGYTNRWFLALDRPATIPPGVVFMLVWTLLYILQGLSLAVILDARGAKGRGGAVCWFVVQFLLALAWTPLFFGAHQVTAALVLIVMALVFAIATTFAFARVRKLAAWLLVPTLIWLSLATLLNWQIDQRNPDAELLVPGSMSVELPV